MKNKEVGISLGTAFVMLLLMAVVMDVTNNEPELRKEIQDLKRELQDKKDEKFESWDAPIAQINPMDPDPESGFHRYALKVFKMHDHGQVTGLVSGKVTVLSQWMETNKDAQGITMCAYEIDVKKDRLIILNRNADCVESVVRSEVGTYVITEKGKRKSHTIATVSMDAKWALPKGEK